VPLAGDIRALDPATDDARAELKALLKTRQIDPRWAKPFYDQVTRRGYLTKAAAEEATFYVRTLPPAGQLPELATPEQVDAIKELIRTRIVPGPLAAAFRARADDGTLAFIVADRWIREWINLPTRKIQLASDLPRQSGWTAPDGYFALVHADGRPRFYRVHTLGGSGKRVLQQITGELRTQRRRIYGYQATEVMRAIAADPAAARILYARQRRRCCRCNQHLEDTDQPGYPHGFGRDCWLEHQAAEAAKTP
jgi:hypothetical protein